MREAGPVTGHVAVKDLVKSQTKKIVMDTVRSSESVELKDGNRTFGAVLGSYCRE